jgi:hypothetical protein
MADLNAAVANLGQQVADLVESSLATCQLLLPP